MPSGSLLDKGLDAFSQKRWKRARELLEDGLQSEENSNGFYHLGLLYWRGLGGERDKRAAVDCFARAANFGHVGAQTAYGLALRSGAGVQKDVETARTMLRSAAGGSDPVAMAELATMSEREEAHRWFRRASELGHAPAMLHFSDFLMHEDPTEALSWLYASVALTGDEAARKRAGALARQMSASEIDAAQKAGRAQVKQIRRRKEKRR